MAVVDGARAVSLAVAFLVACGAGSGPPPRGTQEVELAWASYQMNDEPHYRLIFEGGSDAVRPSEVRIVIPGGATVGSAPTVPSDSDPMRLCPTKTSSPRAYGPLRATVAVPEQQFKEFIRDPAAFRVEAKIADTWRPTRLTLLCHAQQ